MTKYTSLETSRKLYEAFPEWEGVYDSSTLYEDDNGNRIPYYDTDYLLEKLPKRKLDNLFGGTQLMSLEDGKWGVRCDAGSDGKIYYLWGVADTPAEALALLALRLKKEGIL